jgi:outer membrane protein assembly factor BamB
VLRRPLRLALSSVVALTTAACSANSAPPASSSPPPSIEEPASSSDAPAKAALLAWPEFGLNPQRTDATAQSTGITAANVRHLHRRTVALPGTVDSSPIYLHAVSVGGATHNVIVATTTYGRTLAIDAASGQILWTFTPPGYGHFAGSSQITTAAPLADPDHKFVYASSPNGLIHKLSLADGSEDRSGSWPVSITHDATHEKITSGLNIAGPDVIATTGGYFGDAPPYQGHIAAIDRASGAVKAVFNTLCANRHGLIVPSSCSASDSAIWSRAGATVEPGGKRVLVVTGNGPWNGSTNFGDSAIEVTFPALRLRQAFTPSNQQQLNESDTDLGSGGPALLSSRQALIGGKDGLLRVLDLAHMDGHGPSTHEVTGGEAQKLPTPGGAQLFTQPAVWHHGRQTTVFVADENGTVAYALRAGRLRQAWQNGNGGTSPVLAGGLLYVYDPGGGINVYRPSSPQPITKLPGSSGHWNSPIVIDGHVIEPEGNSNDHSQQGTLDIFSAG